MCDTFVAMGRHTADGSVIFGKNSDRMPNEAQALEYYPPQDYLAGAELRCTHVSIPQVRHTYGVLISRPYWIWGAEMGGNERGVVIGNEAVFTRIPRSREPGLIGMDLLRLALERGGSAREALGVITDTLGQYGQGGLHSKTLVYHSSYIIADAAEAWVLETAGDLWAAASVEESASISNGLTIGEEFDESHPELVERATRRGLLRKGESFHFARCFSDRFYTTFSASRQRRRRSQELLSRSAGKMSVEDAFAILRDHGPAGLSYRPDRHLLMRHLCAHAANSLARDAAQSTGSLVAHLAAPRSTFWATGISAPCTSVFKPVWLEGRGLPDLGPPPGGVFDDRSLWWRHEIVHRIALRDLPRSLALIAPRRDELERELLLATRGPDSGSEARFKVTEDAFRRSAELDEAFVAELRRNLRPAAALYPYRSYWRKANREARIPLDGLP
jgi:dipeptidase